MLVAPLVEFGTAASYSYKLLRWFALATQSLIWYKISTSFESNPDGLVDVLLNLNFIWRLLSQSNRSAVDMLNRVQRINQMHWCHQSSMTLPILQMATPFFHFTCRSADGGRWGLLRFVSMACLLSLLSVLSSVSLFQGVMTLVNHGANFTVIHIHTLNWSSFKHGYTTN